MLLDPGAVIGGKYEIERVLGIGGHGVVYAARDLEESLDVAIKLLSHPTGRIPAAISRLRLEREAEILQKIAHPNVV
ncbi:MAG TPA: serine/threonine protein kinase, partial [Myxococcales bacterium]|nr:serine/threonine protein kinase [Myxococcales bacterium]